MKERIVPQLLRVIEVGIAGQDLVNGLGEDRLGGMFDVLGGAWVGETLGQIGDDPQGFFQGPDAEQTCIGDQATAVKGQGKLLRADVPQGKVWIGLLNHELEPPHGSKLLEKHSLDSARGSPFNDSVRFPG